MEIEIITTNDGSHTLYNRSLDETYHSRHGALQEAKHVFIENGIRLISEQNIKILELGFGTGLNACLCSEYSLKNNVSVEYHSLETVKLDYKLTESLNYPEFLNAELLKSVLLAPWEQLSEINDKFYLKKVNKDFLNYSTSDLFDGIFYDAFGPRIQPELWNLEHLVKCFNLLKSGGLWISYCAQGQMKRNLKEAGFKVESRPGPPGKREMTIAYK